MKILTDTGLGATVLMFESKEERDGVANQLLSMPGDCLYYCQYKGITDEQNPVREFLERLREIKLSSI